MPALGVADNGNVSSITNNITPGRSQTFTYDELNRVKSAESAAESGSNAWGQLFGEMVSGNYVSGYDVWGNLLKTTVTRGTNVPSLSVSVDASNHINSGGFSYDAAGNLINWSGAAYTYDAENRLTSAAGVTHTYDGDCRRVKKSNGMLYWYGLGGEVLQVTNLTNGLTAEYVFWNGKRVARLRASDMAVFYFFADHLGSARQVTDAVGGTVQESDYYPFGGERVITETLYDNYKFTGKERDPESGLDNFGARYYASNLGRFLTPDWSAAPTPIPYADLRDPQSMNLYAYVRNNPVNRTDPDGHWCLFWKIGTTCEPDPPPPPPPPPPEPPAVITPGTPQNNLANAQDTARTDPNLAPQSTPGSNEVKTFCNLATCQIVRATGTPADGLVNAQGTPNLANTDANTLAHSTQWRVVTPEEAQNLANQGVTVVAVQSNPGGHGHIATVRPELLPGLQQELGQAPLINNIGASRNIVPAQATGGAHAFANSRPVTYYAPANTPQH